MAATEQLQESSSDVSRAAGGLQVVVGVFTPLALTSIGGLGIYAAPVLLPLLWISTNACRGGGRWYFIVLGSLLAGLSAWSIAWGLAPSLQAALPLVGATAVAVLFVKTWHRNLPMRTIALTLLVLGALGVAGIAAVGLGGRTTAREVNFERSDR